MTLWKLPVVTSLIVTVLTVNRSFAQTATFGAASNYASAFGAYSATVGDFNGDGKQDLAVANDASHNVSILLGNGAGSFGAAANFIVALGGASWVAVPADYDGDGLIDLGVYEAGAWSIVRSSDGGNTVVPFVGNTWTPVPGDYDGDGKTDIAVYNWSNGLWSIWRSSDSVNTVVSLGGGSEDVPLN